MIDKKEKLKEFLSGIASGVYRRGGSSGLKAYISGKEQHNKNALYSADEAKDLQEKGVEVRMKVKISDYYNHLVTGNDNVPPSKALSNLITARGTEVKDLSGEVDPSGQLDYSPVSGLLHKYELALVYSSRTCSAHCRYCYRLDLFSGKSGKGLASEKEVIDYISEHNEAVNEGGGSHPETGRPYLKEVLLSGGDPMVLTNRKLANWFASLANAGVRQVRVGTKEMAFFPDRFDDTFFAMLDRFHEFYPHIKLVFVVHFTHPDEFLKRDREGDYVPTASEDSFEWIKSVKRATDEFCKRRSFISLENQTPIIRDVNDDSDILRILQRELYKHGIGNHYFFQCRMIEGHKAFSIPVEETLSLYEKSQQGLSGVETHARLVMSTNRGKIEIVGRSNNKEIGDVMVFRIMRTPGDGSDRGRLMMARSNPQALWINDYLDSIVFDDIGVSDCEEFSFVPEE